ncbi:MAG: hypothetical protein ACI8RZ_003717 [Myxococcota bacterium]|jgi:hypothetical protein
MRQTMTQASIQSTAEILTQTPVGSRMWFWFCPDLPVDVPMLLLSSLERDPGMDKLNAAAGTLEFPLGGRLFMGLASVSVGGAIRLGAPGLTGDDLAALAGWVRAHLFGHPGLARLKGASFLDIQSDGRVAGIHDDAALWAGIPHVPVAGSIDGTAAVLDGLAEGEDAWFWMSELGGSGSPSAAAVRVEDDPMGRAFRGQVRAIRGEGSAFSGVLRPLTEARMAMTTTGDLDTSERIVTTLLTANQETLRCLHGARLVRMSGGRFVAARTINVSTDGPDLSDLMASLKDLTDGGKRVFWFTTAGKDGSAILVLAEEPGALKAAAKPVQGTDRGMRGQVRMSNKGWLEFRSRKPIDDFIPALAGWVTTLHAAWPGLRTLKGARLTVRDGHDEIVSRHRDDEAWTALP